jgi:hypothetical protein
LHAGESFPVILDVVGVPGCAVMTAFDEAPEIHPDALVTVNV